VDETGHGPKVNEAQSLAMRLTDRFGSAITVRVEAANPGTVDSVLTVLPRAVGAASVRIAFARDEHSWFSLADRFSFESDDPLALKWGVDWRFRVAEAIGMFGALSIRSIGWPKSTLPIIESGPASLFDIPVGYELEELWRPWV